MMKPRSQSNFLKKVLGITILMVLVGGSVVFLAINTHPSYELNSGAPVIGGAPLIHWYPQNDQYSTKNAAGSFEIKSYIITGHKFYLFYVVQAAQPASQLAGQPKDFQLAAFSSTDRGFTPLPKPGDSPINPTPSPDLKLAAPLQIIANRVIATFDNIGVRLATVEIPDQPQQIITFQATLPGQPDATWKLAPVQQINPIGDNQGSNGGGPGYNNESPAYTDVRVEFPMSGGENQLGILKISGAVSATPPLYFQMDRQGNLHPFGQADCARMFPPYPTNPPPKDNGPVTATIAVPAPCNGSQQS